MNIALENKIGINYMTYFAVLFNEFIEKGECL